MTRLAIWIICGLLMYVFEIYWFSKWWGGIGALVAIMVPPLSILFPFIYLAKEGFSILYFGLWAVALVAAFVGRKSGRAETDILDEDDDGDDEEDDE